MPRVSWSLLAGGLLLCAATAAPQQTTPDSTTRIRTERIVPLPEVVTTANRFAILARSAPAPVHAITPAKFDLATGHLVGDLLMSVPGVAIRPYGGGSSLQTLSLRGMSPENTLILLDGQRINNPQNGQADLGFFLPANLERIEIAEGGYSSLYGSDAVGGVVSLTTRAPAEDPTVSAEHSIGSAGFQGTRFAASGTLGEFGVSGSFRRETGKGNYRYLFDDGATARECERNGNDFRILDAQGKLTWRPAPGLRSSADLFFNDGERGVGAAVTDVGTVSRARLRDRSLRTILTGELALSEELLLKLAGHASYAEQRYQDPGLLMNGSPIRTTTVNRYLMLTPELRFTASEDWSGVVGGEVSRAWIRAEDLHTAARNQVSAFVSARHLVPLRFDIPFEIALYPSLRYDHYSDVRGGASPRFGVNVGVIRSPEVRIRGSIGRSFRVPTFNDLYWIAGGNPDLKPERSLSKDVGFTSSIEWNGRWRIEGNYFQIESQERIVWSPTSGIYWTPKNLAEVTSKGAEAEIGWICPDDIVEISLSSTWTDARKTAPDFPGDQTEGKKLVYVPSQMVKGSARVTLGGFRVQLEHLWSSYRYTTEYNDRFLPSYSTTSVALRYDTELGGARWFLKGEVTNLFDEDYQVIALYPMPMREFRLTVGGAI